MLTDERTAAIAAHKIVTVLLEKADRTLRLEYARKHYVECVDHEEIPYPREGFGGRIVDVGDGEKVVMKRIADYWGTDLQGHIHIDPDERYVLLVRILKLGGTIVYKMPYDLVVKVAVLGEAPKE